MSDRIEIAGIEVLARHGVLASEKTEPQTFLLDISLTMDLSSAGASDDLDETIDYGTLAQRAHDLAKHNSFNLIERLAEELASMVLEDQRVDKVLVTVHKPQAPIPVSFGDVSVTVQRGR